MGLKDVKNDILQEAKDEASQIEEEAKEEANQILKEAEEKAEEIKEKAEKEVEEEKETERKKATSSARMKARQEKLKAKQAKLEEVFDSFEKEISDLDEDEKSEFVQNAVNEAEFTVSTVKVSEDFSEAVDGRKYDVEEKTELDGFVLISEDGERRKNFSVSKIVDSYQDRYRQKVAETLFEEE